MTYREARMQAAKQLAAAGIGGALTWIVYLRDQPQFLSAA